MKQFLLVLFIFSVSHVMAQKGDIKVTSTVKTAGTVMATGETISAVEYVFPDRIQTSHMDTTQKRLTVQLRGLSKSGKWLNNKGTLLSYDLNDKRVLWTKGVAFQIEGYEQFGSTIIRTSANKSNFINPDNGTPAWEVKNTIYHVDPIDNLGIGYKIKSSSGVTNTLEGIDLSSGKEIWKRELNREYSWNDLFYMNDSTLMIAAAGLHSVNINNGTGWDYHAVTGKKDYTGTFAANALGIAAGVLTGTFVTSTGHNLVRDVVSNVIVDNTHFYFASKENLARIDKKGNVSWSTPLPEKLTSKSSIFVKDKKVYLFLTTATLIWATESWILANPSLLLLMKKPERVIQLQA